MLLQFINVDPLPLCYFVTIWMHVRQRFAEQYREMLVLDAASCRIDGAVNERWSFRERTLKAKLFLRPPRGRFQRRLPGPRVTATGIGPDERPEHFLGASPLNQQFAPSGRENVDGERLVQPAFTGVGFQKVGDTQLASFGIGKDDLGHTMILCNCSGECASHLRLGKNESRKKISKYFSS